MTDKQFIEEGIKDITDYKYYGFIAGMVDALVNPKEPEEPIKGEGRRNGRYITYNASWYRDMAMQAVNGNKKDRICAAYFFLCILQNIAAGLDNERFNREYVLDEAYDKHALWTGEPNEKEEE